MPETSLDPDLALLGPGSEVPTLDTIRKLADLLDGAHWGQFIVERPALLRPSIILALAEEARALSEAESERLLRALQMCAGGYSRFEHQREKYPVGNGPIEAIFTRVQHGEISMDYGKRLAAKLGAVGLISLAYFRALSWYALTSLAQAGDWQRALTMEGLLL